MARRSGTSDDDFAQAELAIASRYLAGDTPWRQSGFSGPYERWAALRRPVADAIDRSGSFLDVGCANGYLLECIARWVAERGLSLELSGIDLSPDLIALARERLPRCADRLASADARTFEPPRRYDFVRTELIYVPAQQEAAYVARLLERTVAPGGALLVANYLEDAPDASARIAPGAHPTTRIVERLAELGFRAERWLDGFDPTKKGRKVRVAVLRG